VNPQRPNYRKLWIVIGILILLAPIGLILPELFKASGAWGEWDVNELKDIAGYVPEGLKRLSELWSAPFPGYAFKGWDRGVKSYVAYTVSGLLGVVVVIGCTYLFAKIIKRGEK